MVWIALSAGLIMGALGILGLALCISAHEADKMIALLTVSLKRSIDQAEAKR